MLIESKHKIIEELITLHIYAEDYDPLKSWQLATWCKKHGANEWTVSAITIEGVGTELFERFEEASQWLRLPKAKRRQLTAHRKIDELWDFTRTTELWQLTSQSFIVLQEFLPDGLFTNKSGKEGWFEDPVFYRNGEFMLGIVSHESEGILRVTQAERQMLEAEGFPFRPFGSYVGY